MKITCKKGVLHDSTHRAVVVGHFEDSEKLEGAAGALDGQCEGLIEDLLTTGIFKGKLYETASINTRGIIGPEVLIIVGFGKKDDFSMDKLRGVFATAARKVRELDIKGFAASLDMGITELSREKAAEAVVEGVMLGTYQFLPFKTVDQDEVAVLKEFTLMDARPSVLKGVRAGARTAETISRAVCFARDLVTTPANEMTPTVLADHAKKVAAKRDIKVGIIGEATMKRLGMHALLGVARGSHEPPKLIIMEYAGGRKGQRPIVLVGKGITFDSGGISLKPAANMDEMKTDMSGGAAVIGTLMATADLRIPLNIVGVIPATENLPGGSAYKPSDVLKTMSGKTVEVLNTDAEGRLILIDAFEYARRFKPAAMIDMATLTGACVIALGDLVVGMMGKDEDLKHRIRAASRATGEMVWELPLPEEYDELLKSDVADFKNVGGRAGGAITAGIFLSKFVGEYPWVHLDIAGPAWLAKGRPYIPKGASGVGVRLMIELLRNWDMPDPKG